MDQLGKEELKKILTQAKEWLSKYSSNTEGDQLSLFCIVTDKGEMLANATVFEGSTGEMKFHYSE